MDQVLEQGYSPNEKPRALDAFGTTSPRSSRARPSTSAWPRRSPTPRWRSTSWTTPPRARRRGGVDADLDIDPASTSWTTARWATPAPGRLVDPDQGAGDDREGHGRHDVGIDGAAASAEEAAMHVVDFDESDAAIERDVTERPDPRHLLTRTRRLRRCRNPRRGRGRGRLGPWVISTSTASRSACPTAARCWAR
jgi:hypothetical protein